MIRRLALAFAALTSFASPAVAGEAMDKAVAATLYQSCLNFQQSNPNVSCTDAMTSYGLALGTVKNEAQTSYGNKTWWSVLRKLALPQPIALSDGSPYFGGGGATGSWNDYTKPGSTYCANFRYRLSIQNTLIVPTVDLPGGSPMHLGTTVDPAYKYTFGQSDITRGGNSGYDMASSGHSLTLWRIHYNNRSWTSGTGDAAPLGWQGCYSKTASGCLVSSVPYQDAHGSHWMREGSIGYTSTPGFYTTAYPNNKACPEGGFGGGNVHFYSWGPGIDNNSSCTWYYPNPQISPSGYYYATEVALPTSAMNGFPGSMPEVGACNLSADIVKRIAEELRKKAEQLNGAPPTQPITEPKTGGTNPTVGDLGGADANLNNTGTPTDPTPLPGTGGSTGGQDECDFGPTGCDNPGTADPGIGETPTGIMDPIFDWLPDLPSITVTNQSLQCPVWNVDLRQVMGPTAQYLLDSHCDLMESGTLAATLSALMIAVFGIGAALIILRA